MLGFSCYVLILILRRTPDSSHCLMSRHHHVSRSVFAPSSRGIYHVTLSASVAPRRSQLFIASLSGNEISDFAHLTPRAQYNGEGTEEGTSTTTTDGNKTALQARDYLSGEQIRKGPSISTLEPAYKVHVLSKTKIDHISGLTL